jgi:hypothetical protein
LNNLGANAGKDVYLTSNDNITTNPKWLEGTQPNTKRGTEDEKTSVIIVVDKGEGIVDVFYFYFFAFNWGGVVLEKQLGRRSPRNTESNILIHISRGSCWRLVRPNSLNTVSQT